MQKPLTKRRKPRKRKWDIDRQTDALWVQSAQIDELGGEVITHSLTRCAALHSIPLCFAPLHSAVLHKALLAGSFVSGKVAMYERDHMRRYAQIHPIVRWTN